MPVVGDAHCRDVALRVLLGVAARMVDVMAERAVGDRRGAPALVEHAGRRSALEFQQQGVALRVAVQDIRPAGQHGDALVDGRGVAVALGGVVEPDGLQRRGGGLVLDAVRGRPEQLALGRVAVVQQGAGADVAAAVRRAGEDHLRHRCGGVVVGPCAALGRADRIHLAAAAGAEAVAVAGLVQGVGEIRYLGYRQAQVARLQVGRQHQFDGQGIALDDRAPVGTVDREVLAAGLEYFLAGAGEVQQHVVGQRAAAGFQANRGAQAGGTRSADREARGVAPVRSVDPFEGCQVDFRSRRFQAHAHLQRRTRFRRQRRGAGHAAGGGRGEVDAGRRDRRVGVGEAGVTGARRGGLEHGDVASHLARTGRRQGLARAGSQRQNQACIQVRSLMHESTPSVFWEGNFLNRSRGERYAGVTESFKYFLYSFLLAIKYEEAFVDSRIDSYFLHLPLMLDCSLYQLKFGLEWLCRAFGLLQRGAGCSA